MTALEPFDLVTDVPRMENKIDQGGLRCQQSHQPRTERDGQEIRRDNPDCPAKLRQIGWALRDNRGKVVQRGAQRFADGLRAEGPAQPPVRCADQQRIVDQGARTGQGVRGCRLRELNAVGCASDILLSNG